MKVDVLADLSDILIETLEFLVPKAIYRVLGVLEFTIA